MLTTDNSMAQTLAPNEAYHRRQPSINSQTFVVRDVAAEEEDIHDDNSTDSYESQEEEVSPFDPVEYLTDSLDNAMTRLEFNKSIAIQAQTSGKLKSKEMELLSLQAEAQQRLTEFHQTFQRGLKVLQQVSKDLKYSKQKAQQLSNNVQSKYPIEYSQATDKVISRNLSPSELNDNKAKDDNNDNDEIYI